jgi:hypothetical protein
MPPVAAHAEPAGTIDRSPSLGAAKKQLSANALPTGKLTAGKRRAVPPTSTMHRNVRIEVPRAYMARLHIAVRLAQLPRRIARRVAYVKHPSSGVLIVKKVRTADPHAREPFTRRLMAVLKARGIPVISAQL